jgi:Tol biopolymer transport system component
MRSRLAVARSACLAVIVLFALVPLPARAVVVEANGESRNPVVSDDGRYVAFLSDATNLLGGDTANDTNGATDVFLVDTVAGTIRLVSADGATQANGDSLDVDMSGNGRYVVFETGATNLVSSDDNGTATDIFLFDTTDGSLELLSRKGTSGAQANASSSSPSISRDGGLVAFESLASNLVNDTNGKSDVFVKDTLTGSLSRVSTDSSGRQSKGVSSDPVMAAGGGWVAFTSTANNLVPKDTNGQIDGFLKNLTTDKTVRVTVSNTELQSNGSSVVDDVSSSGRYITFQSYGTNLVKNDTNNRGDVFLRDRNAKTTLRVSKDGSTQGNDQSFGSSISSDGGLVVFQTWATNLVGPDGNGAATDVLEYDVATKVLTLMSTDAAGGWTDGPSYSSKINGNGSTVVFASRATDVASGDANAVADVFAHRWSGGGATITRWSVALPVA